MIVNHDSFSCKNLCEMDKCADEKKFILEFIERYECLQALWNVKVDAYSNREEKRKQYEILLEFFKEQYPNATVADVKKRINILRTNFRREKQRLAECSRSGAGAEECVDSNLFYFQEMQFLNDVELACTSKSTVVSTQIYIFINKNAIKNISLLPLSQQSTLTTDGVSCASLHLPNNIIGHT